MIIGHQKQWDFFDKSIKQGQLAHAYLFCGQDKIGKKTFAIELAKKLVGQDVEKGNHPDFLFVRSGEESALEENNDILGLISYNFALPELKPGEELQNKREIEISQIRKVLEFLSFKPYFGGMRVVIIDNAEKMSTDAQNCFLKTLEELKGNTVIFLITTMPEKLLATVRSRCQAIKFFPVKKQEIYNLLCDTDCRSQKAEELADMADGRPGLAVDYFKNPEKLEQEQKTLDEILKVIAGTVAEKFAYTKNIKEDFITGAGQGSRVLEIFRILQNHFRKNLFEDRSAVRKLKLIDDLASKIATTNASPKLAMEIFLLEID